MRSAEQLPAIARWLVPAATSYLPEEARSEAVDATCGDETTKARAAACTASVALRCGSWALQLLRCSHECTGAGDVPPASRARLASPASKAKPASSMDRRKGQALRRLVSASACPHRSPLAQPTPRMSVDRRWEPGAGNPLAGFCPGGGPKGPSLPGCAPEKTGMRKQVSKMHGVSSKSCPRRSPPLGSLSLRRAG
jgi:hypothetical protein